MNLLKELKKQQRKAHKQVEENDVKKEVEQFLLTAHEEDEQILHNIGLDHNIEYDRKLTQDYNRTKKANEIYKQETFTGRQIKALCNTYDLKMLRAQYYNGQIPSDLTRKLKEFEQTTDTNLVDSDNFFILAPVEQFKTIKHVPRSQDPILFYRADSSPNRYGEAQEEDLFVQVHNWGNDFTFLRKFRDMLCTYDGMGDANNRQIFIGFTIGYLLLTFFAFAANLLIPVIILTAIYSFVLYQLNHNLRYHKEWNSERV